MVEGDKSEIGKGESDTNEVLTSDLKAIAAEPKAPAEVDPTTDPDYASKKNRDALQGPAPTPPKPGEGLFGPPPGQDRTGYQFGGEFPAGRSTPSAASQGGAEAKFRADNGLPPRTTSFEKPVTLASKIRGFFRKK